MSSEHELTPDLTLSVQPHKPEPTPTQNELCAPNRLPELISSASTSRRGTGVARDATDPLHSAPNRSVETGTSGVVGDRVDGDRVDVPLAPAEPPPPYSESPRRARRPTRSTAEDSESDREMSPTEASPLLNGRRRRRTASHSTLSSYTGVDFLSLILGTTPSAAVPTGPVSRSFRERRVRYFAPLTRRVYWRSLLHLSVLNFPFALAAWVLLFCGVVLGTTLLITLPFGVVFWFLTLFLSRSFARAELHLQSTFHRPLRIAPADPPRPIFYRPRPAEDIERALTEPGTEVDIDPTLETSFLKNSYTMFMDPSSFQPIFYFLVIKASITLVVTPLVLALAPVCLVLVLPAPAMLRVVRRVGAWQANLAIEALS